MLVRNEVSSDEKENLLTRREFLSRTLQSAAGLYAFSLLHGVANAQTDDKSTTLTAAKSEISSRFGADARWWEPMGKNNIVRCKLCPHQCSVPDGQRGLCGVRQNMDGKYKTLVYSRPVSMHVDPIEKKPLFHFLPTSKAFSLATAGCNFGCKFCQNWEISQAKPEEIPSEYQPPEKIVEMAKKEGTPILAYTYSEPIIFYEYMYDIAKAGKKENLRSVMISNGFINKEPLQELCKVLSAVKIDLKAFTDKYYKEVCSGERDPVLNTLKTLKEIGIWYEIVVLIVPTLNDGEQENREMCRWIVNNLGPDVPVHYSQFFPTYKMMNLPRTPVLTIERCHDIAKAEGIHFVYLGNVWNHKYENTFCPKCDKLLIRRQGYYTKIEALKDGKCAGCGTTIPGVWS